MLVVTVDFRIKPQFVDAFRKEMVANARASREREPGCRRFDVAYSPADPTLVYLYELYDDAAAFQQHVLSEHFRHFDAAVASWVAGKDVRQFALADSGDL